MSTTARLEPRQVDTDAAPTRRLPLSVCVLTRCASGRLAAVLGHLRPIAAEIVVAVDERREDSAKLVADVADEVVLFPDRDPGDALIPWLHSQCHGGWILNLDDDEVPSSRLLFNLPELLASDVTHWWLPRRWLVNGIDTYLDDVPWVPDYQLRLYRNDPSVLRFSDEFHRPVVASGAAGFARGPLWHLDCILNPYERRREKAIAYERARRGMRVAGLSHNSGFYLPELRPQARTARVPDPDLRLLGSVVTAVAPTRAKRLPVRHASRREIDGLWPGAPFAETFYAATLTPRETVERLPAGARHTVTVTVDNRGDAIWRFGGDAGPAVLVGTTWLDEDGRVVEQGIHTPLPADLPPRRGLDLPVHLRAPARPGRYRLSIDLVHQYVRWFGVACEQPVTVTPVTRVALLGRGASLDAALDELTLTPEVEPVLLERGSELTPERFGHERAPGLGDYLFDGIDARIGPRELARLAARTVLLLRRARRLANCKPTAPLPRGAEESLRAVAACGRLHVTGPDWQPGAALTRQLWRLAVTVAAARRLGLDVDVAPSTLQCDGRVDRVLARVVRRWAV